MTAAGDAPGRGNDAEGGSGRGGSGGQGAEPQDSGPKSPELRSASPAPPKAAEDHPAADLPPHALPPHVARHPEQDPETRLQRLTADRRMLETLVCPATQSRLDYDRAEQELISRKARLAFPIRDGIPVLLVGEARALED